MAIDRFYNRIEVDKKVRIGGEGSDWSATTIVIDTAINPKVVLGAGKIKDKIDTRLSNPNNELFVTKYVGDGTTDFTWRWGDIPDDAFTLNESDRYFKVTVDDVVTNLASVSGSTFNFSVAPSVGAVIKVFFPIIESDDIIRVYYRKNAAVPASSNEDYFAIESFVESVTPSLTADGRSISISGYGVIEILFNTLGFALSYDPDGGTTNTLASTMIDQLITQINGLNPNRTITRNITATTSNIQFSARYKRAIEIVEELAKAENTGNGNYVYYVKSTGKNTYQFNFKPKGNTVDTAATITEGTDPTSIKLTMSSGEVVNAVIYNCGVDPAGNGMEFFHYDSAGMTSSGTRWKYYTKTSDIGQKIVNEEFKQTPGGFPTNDLNQRTSRFPDYDFTFVANDVTEYDSSLSNTVSSDGEYVANVRTIAKGLGKNRVTDFIELNNFIRKRFVFDIPFVAINTFELNDIIGINAPSTGYSNKLLRVVQIEYQMPFNRITLEEDEVTETL